MINEELLKRKSAVFQVGLLFNQQPSDEKITAYANALMNYEPRQIIYAFNQVILSGSAFFPSLAEVLKHLRIETEKKEDLAPVIVKEIISLIRSFGKYAEDKMLEVASSDARLVFLAIGNTDDIRNSENFETMQAQLERLAKGVLAAKLNHHKISKLESIGIDTGRLETSPNFKTLDYSDYTILGSI